MLRQIAALLLFSLVVGCLPSPEVTNAKVISPISDERVHAPIDKQAPRNILAEPAKLPPPEQVLFVNISTPEPVNLMPCSTVNPGTPCYTPPPDINYSSPSSVGELRADPLLRIPQPLSSIMSDDELLALKKWGKEHNIKLMGVNRTVNDFYYNGATQSDFLEIDAVPSLSTATEGFYKIPESILKVGWGKTIYFSHQSGRSYSVLASFPEQQILEGLNRGLILEQPLSAETAVHEFGHLVDYHGIRGIYEDEQDLWSSIEAERAEIFAVGMPYEPQRATPPAGYMDVYSTANDAENFAQHFMYYILHGVEFREKAASDPLLQRKYNFFKDKLFESKEY